jgi:hypothetical protein
MAAANILQLLGAVRFLITVANNFLRLSQNKKECRKLELRVETLEALIGWQTPRWSIVRQQQQQQQPWLEALVSSALREANLQEGHGLVPGPQGQEHDPASSSVTSATGSTPTTPLLVRWILIKLRCLRTGDMLFSTSNNSMWLGVN